MTDTVNMTDSQVMTNDIIIIIMKKRNNNKNYSSVIPEKRLSLQFKCKFTSHYTLRTQALQAFYLTSSHGLAS